MADLDIRRRRGASALSAMLLFGIVAFAAAGPASAEDDRDRYQAVAIVTGTDMRSRPSGFAQCLRAVLVNVSGEPRLLEDPRTMELARHADTFVASFGYVDVMAGIPVHDDQGTYDRPHYLTVHFDKARIEAALAELGERPWRGDRPLVVPVLSMRGFGKPYLLSAELPAASDQRASFADRADEFGLTSRIPTEAELAAWGAVAGTLPTPPDAADPDEARVAGTLEFQESLPGWVGSWRLRWRGADYAWRISGVNYDEAFRDIVRGVLRVASGHGSPD